MRPWPPAWVTVGDKRDPGCVSDLGELPWRIRPVRARDAAGVEQIPGERKLDAVDGEVAVERRRPPEVVQPRGLGARLRPQVGPVRHRLAEGADADQLTEE